MKRIAAWLSQFDWAAFVGTALFALFYIGVISPIISYRPVVATEQQSQKADATPDQAAIEEYISRESFWQRSVRDPVAMYTFWLTIFTAALALTTVGLFRHARADAKRQTRQMRVSNMAAIRAANAADKTLKRMEDTAERELRAYLGAKIVQHGVSGNEITGFDLNDTPIVHVEIRNYGQTPAYKVNVWAMIGIDVYPARPHFQTVTLAPGQEGRPLQPTGTYTIAIGDSLSLDADTKAQIESDNSPQRLYVWGEATYEDAFGKLRHTKFRLMYGGTNICRVGKFHWCENGNEAV